MESALEVVPLLDEIEQTRDLEDSARRELAAQCRLLEVPARKRIRGAETGGYLLFLVDGHMACLTDGVSDNLESHRGLNEPIPLFEDNPVDAVAATLTPCLLLRVPAAALDAVRPQGLEVQAIELNEAGSELLAEIYELLANHRLELPARPEVALKIQQLTSDPDAGVTELTEVIQRDGTLAGGLLHAINSPLFRAAAPIQSVRDAVLRMGFRNTRMLTTNLALRHAFKAQHQATREAMKQVWSDAVLCSAFSFLLADSLKILHRERALLAGLVAGIGAVPIIQFIELRNPDPKPDIIDSLVEELRGITGVLVINYWGLGEDLVAVAEHSGHWDYRAEQPDYASVTTLARWSALQREGRPHPPAETVPAFEVLGVPPPPPGEAIAMLAHREDEFRSLKDMFSL